MKMCSREQQIKIKGDMVMSIEERIAKWLDEVKEENLEEQREGTFKRDDNYLDAVNAKWEAIRQFISDDSCLIQKYTECHSSFFPVKEPYSLKTEVMKITKGERFITTEQLEEIQELPDITVENCGASGTGKGTLYTVYDEDNEEICEVVELYEGAE